MLKVSENILIKSVDEETLLALQSKGTHDYREKILLKNNGKISFCVDTNKFLTVYSEGLVGIEQEATWVVLKTKEGEYRLPILRERGVLLSKPEVLLSETELTDSWEFDFSGKSIDTKVNTSMISTASMVVTLGPKLIARSVNNVMELYGDSSTSKISITPEQYSLVSKLGTAKINLFSDGSMQAFNEESEVRIRKVQSGLDIAGVQKNLLQNEILSGIDLSSVKLKTINKFTFNMAYVTLKEGAIVFTSDSARKTFEVPISLETPLTLQVFAKDLKYFSGIISVYKIVKNNNTFYTIKSVDKDKTVYLMLSEYKGEVKW